MLFDTHAHLDDPRFDNDRALVIESCKEEKISYILNAGSNLATSIKAIKLAKEYDFIYASVGVHPHDASKMEKNTCEVLGELAKANPKVKAIGEIGLDYYYDNSPRDIQRIRFEEQINLAKELNLPIIVHDRDAHEDTLKILKSTNIKEVGGVLHSYSGSVEMMKECLKLNIHISLSGPVTFKNARKTVEVAKAVPLEFLLIETDSPYLTPVPHRGERNYPGYVRHVAEKIAAIKELPFEEIAKITLENGKRFFNIE